MFSRDLAAYVSHGSVIKGAVKPTKVRVYEKLEIEGVPGNSDLVQFGLGQVAWARKSASVGASAELMSIAGTWRLPFFGARSVSTAPASSTCVFTSTIFPPLFLHRTVAAYVTDSDKPAFVLPTPLIWVPVQLMVSPLTVHTGSDEPCAKCAPFGALLKLVDADGRVRPVAVVVSLLQAVTARATSSRSARYLMGCLLGHVPA